MGPWISPKEISLLSKNSTDVLRDLENYLGWYIISEPKKKKKFKTLKENKMCSISMVATRNIGAITFVQF